MKLGLIAGGLNVGQTKAPVQSLYNTPVTCVSFQMLAFKTPPPILLCVSVVTCAAVRGGAVDCSGVVSWPLIPMPYICTCILICGRAFCLYFGHLYTATGRGRGIRRDAEMLWTLFLKRGFESGNRVNLYSKLLQQSYDNDPQSCWLMLGESWVNYGVKNHFSYFTLDFYQLLFKICVAWILSSATNVTTAICNVVIFMTVESDGWMHYSEPHTL